MKFYKAKKGTKLYYEYGDTLINEEIVTFDLNDQERRQTEDATAEEIAEAYNASEAFDPDYFKALAEMAEIELKEDGDINEAIKEIENRLGVSLE